MPDSRPLYAVLIDADNIPARHAAAVLKEVTRFGEPALRRVYGDWSAERLRPWAEQTRSLGLVAHQETANTKGKNASDIGLVIDAMDILHSGRFDGFCLVSSDSDFTRLASRIREQGMHAYGFGQRKTPEAFRQACLRFFYIENLMAEAEAASAGAEEPVEEAPETGAAADAAGEPGASEEVAKPRRPEAPSRAVPVIRKAMEGMTDEDGWVSLGVIGQRIGALAPDFDSRTYGSSKLSDLIRRAGAFDMKKDDANHVRVRFKANDAKPKTRRKKDEPAAEA